MPSANEIELVVERPINRDNLKDLLGAIGGAGLIPFVGAGLSQPFGFPTWATFLREQAATVGAEPLINERLARGEYEEAAEELQRALGGLAFEDAMRRTFGERELTGSLPDSAMRALPHLATGPVVTTNFDRVLETVFKDAGVEFEEVALGAKPEQLSRGLQLNRRLLWKLHGDATDPSTRVLTNSEYAAAYGYTDPALVNAQLPLPEDFQSLLTGRPVLFLGSSLEQDRTVRMLAAFTVRRRTVGHYALLEDPGEEARRFERARALSNVGVRPIWFPPRRFDLIKAFLDYLAERFSGRKTESRSVLPTATPEITKPERVVGEAPDRPEHFRSRDTYLRAIGEHFASSARVVSVVGTSGIGKSALAVQFLTNLEQGQWPDGVVGRPVHGIAFLSTRKEGVTLERIVLATARMLGGEPGAMLERAWQKDQLKTDAKVQRLLDASREDFYVILLDHAEDLLDDDGRIIDDGLRTLLERSLQALRGPRFILTSSMPPVFAREAPKVAKIVELDDGLETAEAIAMLRDLDGGSGLKDLPDETLASVAETLHGVPRALEVFAGILADDPTETVAHLLERFYARPEVVADLFEAGINRLDEPSRRVVEALAVVGAPVPLEAIELMVKPIVPGIDVRAVLRRLFRRQTVRITDRVKNTWALHPIDQDYAYAHCPEDLRVALHTSAATWYGKDPRPRSEWKTMDGVYPLLRRFEHLIKAGLHDAAAELLVDFDEEFRGRVGQAARSLQMHLQVEGRITNDRVRLAEALGRAHSYRHVGPLQKALDGYREALQMARAQKDRVAEIEAHGWTGESYRRLARLDEGVTEVRQAVAIAKEINDRQRVARWLGELALNSCYRGDLKEALAAAEEALRTAVEIDDVVWQALSIDALALIHLARGEYVQAIQTAQRTIVMYQNGLWEHTTIYVRNVMGLASLELEQDRRSGRLPSAGLRGIAAQRGRPRGRDDHVQPCPRLLDAVGFRQRPRCRRKGRADVQANRRGRATGCRGVCRCAAGTRRRPAGCRSTRARADGAGLDVQPGPAESARHPRQGRAAGT